jgi:hypothetical protein|tara:strand:- start:13815 stop:14495 length:681 start_codon:yes stop_codon:yes gene_type:complete
MVKQTSGNYGPDNTAEDGSYIVGKGKPPESGKFRKNDGRKRGKRNKGTRNLATDFNDEMSQLVTVTVNGQPRRVSRQRSIIMRVADNASRGQPSAVKTVFDLRQRLGEKSGNETETENSDSANFDNLSDDEFEELTRLIHKLNGEEYAAPVRTDPLAYYSQPPNLEHSYLDSTIEGILYRRYHCQGNPYDLLEVGNRAYQSAALPRRNGFDYNSARIDITDASNAD